MRSLLLALCGTAAALELHVATTGSDANPGTPALPLRTVQRGAELAQPGDTVTVHAGTYRERVHPPTSGVTFQAAAGDAVTLSGAEPVSGWTRVANSTWLAVLPSAAFFGNFNPYMDRIRGDWFNGQARVHHTGAVYMGEAALDEAASLQAALSALAPGAAPQWFATVDGDAGQYLPNLLWIAPRGGAPVSAGAPSWRYGTQPFNTSAGPCASYVMGGDVLRFDGVDFGAGGAALDLSAAGARGADAVVEVHAGDRWGPLLGSVAVPATGGWEAWANFSVPLAPAPTGLVNLSLVFLPAGYAAGSTRIYAQVPAGVDPNAPGASEVNARQSVLYPSGPFVNSITVRGFTLERAATQWAPPSSEQVGIIGTHWSQGWVIEGNEVRYSRCSCVSLGKYGDGTDNTNNQGQADPYTACVYRALANGWHKGVVGGHTVRNNTIHHCGQTGVVGSLGGAFSTVADNLIHNCNWQQTFAGAEMSCIKLHGAVDTTIEGNHLFNCSYFGIWLDWMAQGTMVLSNLVHDTAQSGLFTEVDHGPSVISNNIFLAPALSIRHNSEGNAYAHNLATGAVGNMGPDSRNTPVLVPHATDIARVVRAVNGDHRLYNNLMVAPSGGWAPLDPDYLPCFGAGNVYTGNGSEPSKYESGALVLPDFAAGVALTQEGSAWFLTLSTDAQWARAAPHPLVTTALLGNASAPAQPYTLPDGSAFAVDVDYFGRARDAAAPFPGPFEASGAGMRLQVWPRV